MASPTNPLEGQPTTKISRAKDHATDCEWHHDQYPWECTCGATWEEYEPEYTGQEPADYVAGTPVQFYSSEMGHWIPARDGPAWLSGVRYRYQPLPPPSLTGLDGKISGRRASVAILDDPQEERSSLPEDDASRLAYPMFDGLLAYFPNALAEIAMVSMLGNQQHNPGQPMHWARGKSTDHANKIIRHLVDYGKRDARGVRHTARVAWRALALLQEEIERDEGLPMSRASRPARPDDE